MYFIYHLKAHTLAESISSGVRSHRFSERSPLSFCLSPWSLTRSPSQSVTGVRQVQWAHTYLGHFASLKAHMLAESISSGVRSHRFRERTPSIFSLSPWSLTRFPSRSVTGVQRYSEHTPYLGHFVRSIVTLEAHTLAESISCGVRSHRFSERTPSLFSLSPWSLTWLPSWSVTGGILSRANMYNEHTQNVRAGHTLFLMTYLGEFVNQYVMYQIGVLK